MTAGLRLVGCLQEAGWNQARRIQQTIFLPPVSFFEKGSSKVYEPFQPGLNCLHAFQLFSTRVEIQPGLSCKRAIAFMYVPG